MKNFVHKRRTTPRSASKAFTVVEILVVVVIIVILASLVLAAYGVVTRNATDAAMRADLQTARNDIAILRAGSKNYPSVASAANDGQGLKASGTNSIIYGGYQGLFCVSVSNPSSTTKYQIFGGDGDLEAGNCGGVVTTIAGNPVYSTITDGTGSAASFDWPAAIARDSSNNLYVADCGSSVRRVTPAGVVTTVAGDKNTYAYAEGTTTTARFQCVRGIALTSDASTIYASDNSTASRLRRIAGGNVTTLAGGATRGPADGTGAAAQFSNLRGLALDGSGNIYAADEGTNDRIRRITPAGVVTTFAGSMAGGGYAEGTGTAAQFNNPIGVVFDSSGNLYVADSGNRRIRQITPAGVVSTFAGSGTNGNNDGVGTAASFRYPSALAIDSSNNLYVADALDYRIRKITPSKVVTTLAGVGIYGYSDSVGLTSLFGWNDGGLVVDSNNQYLYVVDSDYYVIRRIQL